MPGVTALTQFPPVRSFRLTPPAAALLYLAYALMLTWPLALDPGSVMYGQHSAAVPGDLPGSIALMAEMIHEGRVPFLPGTLEMWGAPDGVAVQWAMNVGSLPSTLLLWLAAVAIGAHAAYALFIVTGYVATGVAVFLLARWLSAAPWVALLVGWAVAFSPYAVLAGTDHPQFIHGWVLVLLVWRMLALSRDPTLVNGVLAGAATILALWWTAYFVLLGGVCWAALAGADLLSAARRRHLSRRRMGAHALTAVLAIGFVVALAVLTSLGPTGVSARQNPLPVVDQYSARPLEYLVPPAKNLLFGSLTEPFLVTRSHGSTETTLYLGISMLLLATLAMWHALRRRPRSEPGSGVVLALAGLAVTAVVLSGPPHASVGGHVVSLPSRLIYIAAPAFRVYARLGILATIAVGLLAATGLTALSRRLTGRRQAVVLAVLAIVVVADVATRRPSTAREIATPGVYLHLRTLPSGGVAAYPIVPAAQDGVFDDLYFRPVYGKPALAGFAEGTRQEEEAMQVRDVRDRDTPGKLAVLGIRYVIVPTDYTEPSPIGGLRKLYADADHALYEVRARPMAVVSFVGAETVAGSSPSARWLTTATATIHVRARCDDCRGTLYFGTTTFARARTLVVSGPALAAPTRLRVRVGASAHVHLRMRFIRETTLRLTMTPAPEPGAAVGDPRTLGLTVEHPAFRPR